MRRRFVPAMALALSFIACLLAPPCLASVGPSSVSLAMGLAPDLGDVSSFTPVPSLDLAWRLGSHAAVRSSVGYLQERQRSDVIRGLSSAGYLRDLTSPSYGSPIDRAHYVPVSVGLRLYLAQRGESWRGLFIEGAPAAYVAMLPAPDAAYHTRLLGGARGAIGARFGAVDGSRGELGIAYYYAAGTGQGAQVAPASVSHTPVHGSFDSFSVYLAFGFGD
ncbi:MAG TPA: hypothetical protein VF363_08400 [Candidatus Eisenbacteria bacterium]